MKDLLKAKHGTLCDLTQHLDTIKVCRIHRNTIEITLWPSANNQIAEGAIFFSH